MQFYHDTSKDPCGGIYGCIMQRFDPESVNAVAAEVLLEQALGSVVFQDVDCEFIACIFP